MENQILELAKLVQFNAKAEAQAVLDYTEMIRNVIESDIADDIKSAVLQTIEEIIADELNHETKLHELYTYLTGIEQNQQ